MPSFNITRTVARRTRQVVEQRRREAERRQQLTAAAAAAFAAAASRAAAERASQAGAARAANQRARQNFFQRIAREAEVARRAAEARQEKARRKQLLDIQNRFAAGVRSAQEKAPAAREQQRAKLAEAAERFKSISAQQAATLKLSQDGRFTEQNPESYAASLARARRYNRGLIDRERERKAAEDQGNSLINRATRLAGDALTTNPVGRGVLDALDLAAVPQEELMQVYHGAKLAQLEGAGLGKQLASGLAQTPGLGHTNIASGLREQYGERINSREEREALRAQGLYASPGEFITGQAREVLNRSARERYDRYTNSGLTLGDSRFRTVMSALTDAGVTIATDPLTYVPAGVASSGLSTPTTVSASARQARRVDPAVLREAAEAARDSFLTSTRRGRVIEAEARRLAAVASDVVEVERMLPGIPTTTARDIASAPTVERAQEIISRALRSGEYAPNISLRRQALLATTGRGLRAPSGIGLGRRVARQNHGLFNSVGGARQLANRTRGRVAVSRSTSTAQARRAATKAALRQAGLRTGDARASLASAVQHMTPFERVNQALLDASGTSPLIADIVESSLEAVLPTGTSPQDFSRQMANLANNEEAMRVLEEVETLLATARGDFGDDAAKQLAVEVGVGYSRPQDFNIQTVVRRAGNRAGLSVPKMKGYKKATEKAFDEVGGEIDQIADEALKGDLRGILAKIQTGPSKAKTKNLNYLRRTVGLAQNADVAADAAGLVARYGDAAAARPTLVGGARVGIGQRLNPVRKIGKVVTSLQETVAPNQIRFLDTENIELAVQGRVEALNSYMGELGLADEARSALRQAAAEVGTENDLYRLVDRMLAVYADAEGVPGDILSDLLEKMRGDARRAGFKTHQAGDEAGELIPEVQNLSQLSEAIPLPDPVDVKKTAKRLRKALDDPDELAEIRRYLDDPSDTRKIARSLQWLHRTWKLMVVTNLYMPVVGGFAGFAGTEGDFTDRLKGGFQWGALGALAPSRYILRIGIEETARRTLMRGFNPTEFIPGIAKWRATRGVDRPLMSPHLLSSGDPTGLWLRNQLSTHATGEFSGLALPDTDGILRKLSRKDSRYIESWRRIINHEINDANGAVDRILLGLRGKLITQKEADVLLDAFLKSPDGELWWRRWKGAFGAPGSKEEAFWRQHDFINDYVPEDIARARLPAMDAEFQEVPTSLLKAKVRAKEAPAFIHAENTWKLPRPRTWFQDIGKMKDAAVDKLIFGGPTRTMQRRPLARALYRDEYLKLVRGGVEPERAAQLADQRAINVTNEVMFNQNNESRFSSKVDFFFPFQQPREELVRVWAPMVFNNKLRTIQITSLGARALENGASSGVFYQYTNPYTGEKEWRMKVPGSATLSRALGGVNAQFDFGLKDIMFLSQGTQQISGIPSPGGPFYTVFTRSYLNAFPEHYEALPSALQSYLFPFGSSGRLGRAEPNRLWMSLMGTPAPWEFANEFEQRNEYNKVQVEMFLTLRFEHFKETGEWVDPTFEEVDQATKAYFQTQASIGALWPAATRYVQPWQELVEQAKEPYLDENGELDYFAFVNDHPEMAPFLSGRNEYVGPDTLRHWSRDEEARANDWLKHYSKAKSVREFKAELDSHRLTAEAWRERTQIPFRYADHELADAYVAWEEKWSEKHPEVVESTRNNYFRDEQLFRIMHMAEGAHKDRALDQWRRKYDMTFEGYKRQVAKLEKEGFRVDYWRYSRPTADVLKEVKSLARKAGISEDVAVTAMNPAEQVKYWKAQQRDLDYYDGETDPQDILDRYYLFGNRVSDLYKKHPALSGSESQRAKKGAVEAYIDKWRGNYGQAISAVYDEIGTINARIDEFPDGYLPNAQWEAKKALQDKRSSLYDMVEKLKNQQFRQLPGILGFMEDMEAATALLRPGKKLTSAYLAAIANIMRRGIGQGGFIPSNEELGVLSMPDEVREAYVADLRDQLSLPAVKGQKGKLYWEWLTDFQKDYLERNLPEDLVNEWKDVSPDDAVDSDFHGGFGGRGYYRFGKFDPAQAELSYAFAQFKLYNKRPEGAEPPKGYAEYLKLPRNPVVRNEFLDRHPEVAQWIAMGPMANMPSYMRYIVQNIMIKHGKWQGETMDDQAIVDLSFAREQLARWNRRGKLERPDAYDVWLNMPTGVGKAQYLEAHPEIGQWLRLGPMANMPDAYQDVIRDIMVRYGEWTSQTDALGTVISGYYDTPGYAREQYLEEHPELVAYWNAIRTPEEKKMAAKVDQYFSISDPTARRAFMLMHPDLKDYFVQRRTERYEKFLNQVAIYMGSNPELFRQYLERQEDVLNDLMMRYAHPTLLREVAPLRDVESSDRQRRRG